jgi:hypothetical protein
VFTCLPDLGLAGPVLLCTLARSGSAGAEERFKDGARSRRPAALHELRRGDADLDRSLDVPGL